VVVCLVGGGQEIHSGEAGIGEWLNALGNSFPGWKVHVSPHLTDAEYAATAPLAVLARQERTSLDERLHLATSMRSFRLSRGAGIARSIACGSADPRSGLTQLLQPGTILSPDPRRMTMTSSSSRLGPATTGRTGGWTGPRPTATK